MKGEAAVDRDLATEYDVVKLRLSWGVVSLLIFAGIWTWGELTDWTRGWRRVWGEIMAALAVGLITGVIGWRRDKRRFPALIGSLLNGGLLLVGVASVAAFFIAYNR